MFHSEAAVSEELEILYLNVNGLLHENHLEDLASDCNFKEPDLVWVLNRKCLSTF